MFRRRARSAALSRLEDLLDGDIEAWTDLSLQGAGVALRIGEAVDMVDPQPVHMAFFHEAHDELVRLLEDLGDFDPNARQGVDVEEAAVVDVARCHPPDRTRR